MLLREEAVQTREELLEDHDVVSSVLKIVFPRGELNLESDIFKNREDNLAYDLTPKALTKVCVMLFEGLFERVESFVPHRFVFLCNQAREVAENWEPELLKSAKTNCFRRRWNIGTSFVVGRLLFGRARNSLLLMILILNAINSIRFHIFEILLMKRLTLALHVAIHYALRTSQLSCTDSKQSKCF